MLLLFVLLLSWKATVESENCTKEKEKKKKHDHWWLKKNSHEVNYWKKKTTNNLPSLSLCVHELTHITPKIKRTSFQMLLTSWMSRVTKTEFLLTISNNIKQMRNGNRENYKLGDYSNSGSYTKFSKPT